MEKRVALDSGYVWSNDSWRTKERVNVEEEHKGKKLEDDCLANSSYCLTVLCSIQA